MVTRRLKGARVVVGRPGPPGPPGNLPGSYYTAPQTDALLADKADVEAVNAKADITYVDDGLANKADTTYVNDGLAGKVSKTGDETIAGVKTFTSSPVVPEPTTDQQAASKGYVEAGLATKLDDTSSPVLIMSPDQTRDRRGTVTPDITGTVTTVAGQYGDAWSLDSSDAGVRVPKAGRWSGDVGTVLVRARLTGPPVNDPYSLTVNGASPNRFRMGISSTSNPRVLIGDQNFTETFSSAPDYTAMYVHAVRFDTGAVRQFINGVGGTERSYSGTADGSTTTIAITILTSGATPYEVESVLIFPTAIPDSEIERLSTMEAAWTWETARLRAAELVDIEDEIDAVLAGVLARLLPSAGNPGQLLGKLTGTDYDARWTTPPGVVEPTLLLPLNEDATGYGRTGPFTMTTSGALRFEEVR